MRLFLLLTAVLGILCAFAQPVYAQTIIENRPFAYGTLVTLSNDAAYAMRIRRNGSINPIDSHIVQVGAVNSAEFDFTGFPSNTTLNISFSIAQLMGPGGNYFDINSFDLPSNTNTNGFGSRTVQVGSTFNTSGNSLQYTDGGYSGTMILTVTY